MNNQMGFFFLPPPPIFQIAFWILYNTYNVMMICKDDLLHFFFDYIKNLSAFSAEVQISS